MRRERLSATRPFSDDTRALRTVVRTREDIVHLRVMATNMLSALLDAFWPDLAKHIFKDIESPIALAFLDRYPTPASAAYLGEKRLAAFCAQPGYSGHHTPAQLLARLRGAPAGVTDPAQTEAGRDAVLAVAGVLRAIGTAKKSLDRHAAHHLEQHPDGHIFTSLSRAGRVNAAQILAEWGDSPEAFAGPDAVAALAGVVPVTKTSGKHSTVAYRWACSKRFRQALVTFADNSRHASPWAAEIYQRARDRSMVHPHAVRVLARAWVRDLPMLARRQAYDPARHGAAQRSTNDPAPVQAA